MGWGWDESRDAHQDLYGREEHQAKISHELIGGAAAFEAMKLYEDRQRRNGETVSHGKAKEFLAALAGAEVDRLAETKGEDAWDRHKAKEHARESAEEMYDQHYVRGHRAEEYDPNRYDAPDFSYRN